MDLQEVTSWKQTFFNDHFSVDQCLSEYIQRSDLETLRKDLKNYSAELQLQMSEILKNETEAIVNLAEYLTNLNSKIDNLSIPISQLREEIRTLYDLICTAEHNYKLMMFEIKDNKLSQNHVYLKLGIIMSSTYINTVINTIEDDIIENLVTLERIINKYSFQKTYLDVLNLMTPDIENVVSNVEIKLIQNLNNCFLKACNEVDKNILLRCLRMYVDLQKEDEAHNTFRIHIIRPQIRPLFTERYFEKCGYDLDIIYLEVKRILENKVETLSDIIKANLDLNNSFNFVLHSFWTELDCQSCEGLSHITAPGNPENFQKRFTSTYKLLKYTAEKAGNRNLVYEDESFKNHLKRFNLPVYFEIRFQQIAGNFETDTFTVSLNNILADQNEHSFKLKPSTALWKALVACFHEDVFINQLADSFIRLSIMLLSRHIRLMEKLLKDIMSSEISGENVDQFIINVLHDLNIVKKLVAPPCQNIGDVEKTIYAVTNKNFWHVILKVILVNEKTISQFQTTLQNHIILSKIKECTTQLQNVTAIPRLYRRTNRSPPKETSTYMVKAVKPIITFENRFGSNLDQQLKDIVNSIIVKVTNQYLSLVREVLLSVCKTEESLRRLKSRTLNTSADETHGPTDTMSDEAKIREQIKYDVGYFYDKLYPLGMESAKEAMDLLRKEVCS